jgi:cyclopropane-fatty-acyl-phospholipid synthase
MQRQKHELICKKLSLSSQDNIIDIGCGWGGMLIYAAEKYGVSGTGVTLSQEQAQFATQKIQKRGLSQQLNIVVSDYREFTGQYDKFISMAMFEHVGKGNFSTFMEKASELLKPGGTGLLHTMGTTSAGRRAGRDAWIEKYIFPGGYLPKLHDLMYEMWRARLNIAHHENLRPHYPETLSRWSDKFQNNRDKIMALAPRYDERFMRMWNFYLQVCEANFRYGNVQVFQILFYKGKKWPFTTPFDFTIDP